MKQKSIVIAALLSLIVLGSSLGRIFLPEWCVFALLIVFVFILVCFVEKICVKEKVNAIELMKDLSINVCSVKTDLLSNLDLQKNILLEHLSKKQEGLLKQVKESTDFINEESQRRSELIIAKICAQTEFVNALFASELEQIRRFEEEVKNMSTQIGNQISSFSEDSQNLLNQMFANIIADAEESRKLIDGTSLQINTLLNAQNSEVKNIIESLSASFVKLSKEHNDTLCAKVDNLSLQEDVASKKMSESLNDILQMDSLIKVAVAEYYGNLAEKIELFNNSFLDSITKVSTESSALLSEKVHELCNFTGNKNIELLEGIKHSESNVCANVETNIKTAVNSFNTVFDVVKKQHDAAVKLVLQADKDYSDKVQLAIAEFAKQYENIENVLVVTKKELNENVLGMQHTLQDASKEIADSLKKEAASIRDVNATKISSGVSQILQSVRDSSKIGREDLMKVSVSVEQGNRNLIDKLNSIEKQRMQDATSMEQKLNQQKIFADKKLQTIEENCGFLNKCLVDIRQTSKDVKVAIRELSEKNDVDAIVGSVKTLIAELSLEVKESVSELENQVLDAQESQKGINNELKNLQVLLRTLLKSKEEQTEKKVQTSPTINGSHATSEEPKKSLQALHERVIVEPNPNRQETILDNESGNLVLNSYKDNSLVKSIMKNKHGRIIYEMEYAHGKLIRSKNYDEKGKVNIEQTYYDNGQVHFRNEFTKNGKVSTEFDNNGKRK